MSKATKETISLRKGFFFTAQESLFYLIKDSISHEEMKVSEAKIIDIPKIEDRRGNLSVVEEYNHVSFHIARAYWLYDVPGGESRGGHAHRRLKQLLIAVSGSFTVTLDDGHERRKFLLNHPYQGMVIETGIWRTLDDFSSGAVCLVLASEVYDESDYIYDYQEFLKYKGVKPDNNG